MFSGSRKREEKGRVREREGARGREREERAITIVCSQDECVDAPETKHIQEVPRHRAYPATHVNTTIIHYYHDMELTLQYTCSIVNNTSTSELLTLPVLFEFITKTTPQQN